MKKYRSILISFILLFSLIFIYNNVCAISVSDYRKELAEYKAEKEENDKKSAAAQAKIAAAKQELANINTSIIEATKEIEQTSNEIKELGEKINIKKEQIKQLVSFFQISNSENFYLKYIFGAEDFTDLIYRVSVIQQLTEKSDELITEMKSLIKENEEKIKTLEAKKVELNKLNESVLIQISKLGNEQSQYFEEGADIDTQIAAAEKQIKFYLSEGCNETQDLSTCVTSVPYDTSFIRPTKSGNITDNYGWRSSPCYKCSAFHKGIDIGGNREGTPVLASAAGKVSDIDKYGCGGKVLTIDHLVNGKKMSTRYYHLLTIKVNVGDIVVQGQTVATVGGGNTAYYDSCTTGAHLHFEVVVGYYKPLTYLKNVTDPRNYVSFPAYGVYW